MASTSSAAQARSKPELSRSLTLSMAIASGVAVANLYYNQPLLADMARALHVDSHAIGLVATATQIGYAAGMPVFVPLGDFVERRTLTVCLFVVVAGALAGTALAPNLPALILASFLVGMTTIIAQILIPLAAELTSAAERGKTIGTIMTGLLLGILLARTVSGVIAQHFGWRLMYWVAAALAIVFAGVLSLMLPHIPAHSKVSYAGLMRSITDIIREEAKLRQVSITAGLIFASFSAFWTTLIFHVSAPPFRYGPQEAGLFGLVGAVGAAVAPWAGRLSDTRSPRFVVKVALGILLVAFVLFWGVGNYLWGLIIGVVVLDAGAQAAQVANQTRVLSLRPDARNRVNTVYMISYFTGGSLGSLAGSLAWSRWGWNGVCFTAITFVLLAAVALFSRGPVPDRISSN